MSRAPKCSRSCFSFLPYFLLSVAFHYVCLHDKQINQFLIPGLINLTLILLPYLTGSDVCSVSSNLIFCSIFMSHNFFSQKAMLLQFLTPCSDAGVGSQFLPGLCLECERHTLRCDAAALGQLRETAQTAQVRCQQESDSRGRPWQQTQCSAFLQDYSRALPLPQEGGIL